MGQKSDKRLSESTSPPFFRSGLLKNLLLSGLGEDSSRETLHRVRIINALSGLAALFLLIFAVIYILQGHLLSGLILVIPAGAMVGVIGYLRVSRNHRTAGLLTCGAAFVFCLVRLHYAPPDGFGFLWSLMVPLLTVFILGHRIGGVAAVLYLAAATVALALPENPLMRAEYAPGFALRFIFALLGILTAACYVEFDRTRATQALHSTDHRFRSLIENSASAYAVIAADGTVLYESPSVTRIYGYAPEELVGTNILDAVHPEEQAAALAELEDLIANPAKVKTIETRYRHKDGSWRDIAVSGISLLHDLDVGGVILSSHDITERKRAEREVREVNASLEQRVRERTAALARSEARLRQSEKMQAIGELAGGVAHDFNNQLTAILSCLEMLGKGRMDPRRAAVLDAATTAARRAADLTAQMLAFARKRSGLSTPVDLRDIVQEVISLLKHSIDKRIEIREDLREEPLIVIGDAGQLHSALLNLALNARDAMPEGGEIRFAAKRVLLDSALLEAEGLDIAPGRYVILSVEDTGSGLTEAVRRRAFEPFFTTKPVGEGTGMGLAAVYGTARVHQGTITVESQPGNGARFSLYLPLSDATTRVARSTRPPPDSAPPAGPKLRILLVDDEAAVRQTFELGMAELGHEVLTCKDGRSAIEMYRRRWREVDVVVLDMVMPKLNGRQTFLALKEINADVRVLLASGFDMNRETEATLDAGAAGFIQKPFQPREVAHRLIELVGEQ